MFRVSTLIVLILMLVSCESEDVTKTGTDSFLPVSITAFGSASSTAKPIKRGDFPAHVASINIKATNGAYNYSTNFELTNNASDPTTLSIDKVKAGVNTFDALTTSNVLPSRTRQDSKGYNSGIVQALKNKEPYAIYTGTTTQNIVGGGAGDNVGINMTTQNTKAIFIISNYNHTTVGTPYSYCDVKVMCNDIQIDSYRVGSWIEISSLTYWYFNDDIIKAGDRIKFVIQRVNSNNVITNFTSETVTLRANNTICKYIELYGAGAQTDLGTTWHDM